MTETLKYTYNLVVYYPISSEDEKLYMKKSTKIIIGIISCLVFLVVCFGGYKLHKSNQTTPDHVSVEKVSRKKHKKHHINYLDYNADLSHVSYQQQKGIYSPQHAKSALVMDANNGKVIYQKNPLQLRKVASNAKLMTLFLVEQKANQDHSWNQKVNIPNNLRSMSYDTVDGLGGFKFKRNHTYTVSDLFKAALIQSSNNSAIALGEWVANGNNNKFIDLMNKQAHLWHLKGYFVSSSGLENDSLSKFRLIVSGGKKGANEISALDLAIIARHFLQRYPNVINTAKQTQSTVDNQQLYNVNGLLPSGQFYDSRLNVDGLKTGFTDSAGYCFVGTAQPKGKQRIITVVLHDDNEFSDTRKMMDSVYGFKNTLSKPKQVTKKVNTTKKH